ncbi:hypothetical protein V5799_028052 [Amblyomma americanum]|uniref:Secreted protein n=1 Tax=Amblyomma americanum TaxID=6943 RepID=A0AAQ4DDZ3_AMBAM
MAASRFAVVFLFLTLVLPHVLASYSYEPTDQVWDLSLKGKSGLQLRKRQISAFLLAVQGARLLWPLLQKTIQRCKERKTLKQATKGGEM